MVKLTDCEVGFINNSDPEQLVCVIKFNEIKYQSIITTSKLMCFDFNEIQEVIIRNNIKDQLNYIIDIAIEIDYLTMNIKYSQYDNYVEEEILIFTRVYTPSQQIMDDLDTNILDLSKKIKVFENNVKIQTTELLNQINKINQTLNVLTYRTPILNKNNEIIKIVEKIISPYFKFNILDFYGDRGVVLPKIEEIKTLYFKQNFANSKKLNKTEQEVLMQKIQNLNIGKVELLNIQYNGPCIIIQPYDKSIDI